MGTSCLLIINLNINVSVFNKENVRLPVSCHEDQGVDADGGRGEDQELVHLEKANYYVAITIA